MSSTPANTDDLTKMVTQSKTVYAAVKSTPFIVKASKEEKVVKSKKPEKVGKASKMEKVVKSKKPKKAIKKTVEINDFHKKLFKEFPIFLPASPQFSDGQINEFQYLTQLTENFPACTSTVLRRSDQ